MNVNRYPVSEFYCPGGENVKSKTDTKIMTKKGKWRIPLGNSGKILRWMNLMLCILALSMPLSANVVMSQVINIRTAKVCVREAFDQLKQEAGVYFMYEDEKVGDLQVRLNFKDASLRQVLDEICRQTGLSYEVVKDYVLIRKTAHNDALPQQDGRKVEGVLTDAAGNPLPGGTIMIKGTTLGVASDIDGKFQVQVNDPKTVLVISYVGYISQEITVGNQTLIKVQLQEEERSLDEVVVVAYGTKTKATITGALSTMDTKELLRSPAVNVTQALAGALPGVATVQSSGQPGRDAATIYVRGNGSLNNSAATPLVLVDGVERSFSDLDANEIETLSVLKDASSTAVYGVRGANGVILITTRRGTTGKPQISVSTNIGLQQPISLVDKANSYDYARFWNIRAGNDGSSSTFTPEQIEAFRTHSDPLMYPDIDWQDYLFHKLFVQNKNNINISGGSDKVKYFVNFGYVYQNGLLKQFDELGYDNNYRYDRYNYRANLDIALSNSTTMKLNIGGNSGKVKEPIAIEDVGYVWNVATVWSVPFAGPGIVDGVRTLCPQSLFPTGDKIRDGLFAFYGYGYKHNYETKLNVDVDITQKLDRLTEGLSVGIKGAYDSNFTLSKRREASIWSNAREYQTVYYRSMLTNPSLPATDPRFDKTIVFVPEGNDTPLKYSEGNSYGRNWYLEARVNYDRTFAVDHKVSALVLYNQSRTYYPTSYSYLPKGYVGLVGRATYGYKNKYLVDFSIGYNGSENFAPGKNRFGVFPSVSGAWVASSEKFMENQKVVDYLKFRVSWGRVGSDVGNKQRFMYMTDIWNDNNGSYNFGVNNPNSMSGATLSTSGNPDVTWETADKQNYGIDANFLNSRLSVSADYFFEKRTGILITPNSVPNIIATSLPNMNLGRVNNKGFELVVGWKEEVNNNFRYNLNFNVSHAKNKIMFMDEVKNQYDYMNRTGGSTDRYGGMYKFEGFYQYSDFDMDARGNYVLKQDLAQPYVTVQPGDAKYADLNGDGTVDTDDQMVSGYSTRPEYVFGIVGGLEYKGFAFSMQWTGATHVNKMIESDYRTPFTNADRGLLQYFVEDSWTPENQYGAKMPRLSKNMESWNCGASTMWLKNAAYLRLKTIDVSYTLRNKRALTAVGIKSVSFTLSAFNLLTFSKLKIIDPEAITDNAGQYPLTKVYNLGIGINF